MASDVSVTPSAAPSPETPDGLTPWLEHSIRLEVFEGPLDLLLFLIRRNEIDIYNIPIESVTRQYIAVLRTMDRLNLEVAGEFFVMAATLMYIKSRMLLPKNEALPEDADDPEEDVDPRWELVQQLIEYKKFKEAAATLERRIETRQEMIERYFKDDGQPLESRPLRPSDRIEVWNTFNLVLRRLAEQMVQGEIHGEQVTVAECMELVLQRLSGERTFLFSSLMPRQTTLGRLVSTFIAILELARLRKLEIQQNETFSDIVCYRVDESAELAGNREEDPIVS